MHHAKSPVKQKKEYRKRRASEDAGSGTTPFYGIRHPGWANP